MVLNLIVAVPGDRESGCCQMNIMTRSAKRTTDQRQKKADQQQQADLLPNTSFVTQEHDGEILMWDCNQSKQKSPEGGMPGGFRDYCGKLASKIDTSLNEVIPSKITIDLNCDSVVLRL